MPHPNPRIRIPFLAPPPSGRASSRRLAHLAAELLLTACVSSAILLGVLHLIAFSNGNGAYKSVPLGDAHIPSTEANAPDASPLFVLRITTVCTLLVYACIEGGAALLRLLRPRTEEAEAPEGIRALEAGWREPFAIVKVTHAYGSVETPFAMAPARANTRP